MKNVKKLAIASMIAVLAVTAVAVLSACSADNTQHDLKEYVKTETVTKQKKLIKEETSVVADNFVTEKVIAEPVKPAEIAYEKKSVSKAVAKTEGKSQVAHKAEALAEPVSKPQPETESKAERIPEPVPEPETETEKPKVPKKVLVKEGYYETVIKYRTELAECGKYIVDSEIGDKIFGNEDLAHDYALELSLKGISCCFYPYKEEIQIQYEEKIWHEPVYEYR